MFKFTVLSFSTEDFWSDLRRLDQQEFPHLDIIPLFELEEAGLEDLEQWN